MNLLQRMYEANNKMINWQHDETTSTVGFNDVDDCYRSYTFEQMEDDTWCVDINIIHDEHIATYQSIVDAFVQHNSKNDDLMLEFHTLSKHKDYMLQILKPLKHVHDFLVYEQRDGEFSVFTASKSTLLEHQSQHELLMEEPNTSLMYHKLFPDKRLLRDLETHGYSFQMGSGLKIYKKYYASTHRGSGPSQRRTLQSIVILKDGKFFRKIPKSKWVQLIDPSDKDSVSWGTAFMKKMLANEVGLKQQRKQALLKKRKERLAQS